MSRISNSALDTYQMCPKKYYFQYVLGYKADLTKTPLLFGTAMDAALNYILESIRDKKEWSVGHAKQIFTEYLRKWEGQNRLDYFKNEVPEAVANSTDPEEIEQAVWENIYQRGLACIDVYVAEIIPLIDEVLHVQYRFDIPNDDGDTFTGVIDFVAKLKDGRIVLFDNKTASAKYKKKAVEESQQLSFYMDQFPELKLAGYIVLIKDPTKHKGQTHQILIGEIPEETIQSAFKRLDETMHKIKAGEFPCNYKSCMAFGKACEYERLCSFNDDTGLIKSERSIDKKEKV